MVQFPYGSCPASAAELNTRGLTEIILKFLLENAHTEPFGEESTHWEAGWKEFNPAWH